MYSCCWLTENIYFNLNILFLEDVIVSFSIINCQRKKSYFNFLREVKLQFDNFILQINNLSFLLTFKVPKWLLYNLFSYIVKTLYETYYFSRKQLRNVIDTLKPNDKHFSSKAVEGTRTQGECYKVYPEE